MKTSNVSNLVNVSLTEEGKKYLLKSDLIDRDNDIFVKISEVVYLDIVQFKKSESRATAKVNYYIKYSPFGEALGYITDIKNVKNDFVEFEKIDDDWVVVEE